MNLSAYASPVKTFLHKPQSLLLRRVLFQVHLWVGVLAGLYIVVVCVTGAALVFRIDMQRAAHPHLFTPIAVGPLAEAAVVMESVRAAYPRERVSGVEAPTTTRPNFLAYTVGGTGFGGTGFRTLLVDPVSARVLGELPERSIVRTVQDLHFNLLAGRTGRVVNGIGGLCLLVMALTGPFIWWPGVANWRRGLRVDVTRSARRVTWELHSAVGFWTAALIAMWAVTGVYFAFPSAFRSAVNAVSPVTVTQAPQSSPPGASRAAAPSAALSTAPSAAPNASPSAAPNWADLIERARQRVPGQFVARVVVPSTDRAAFLVMLSAVRPTPAGGADLTSVYLDQYSGEVLQEAAASRRTIGDVVMAWVAPLHVGNFDGPGVRVVWLVLGLSPALLFVTGLIMWWTRVVRPREKQGGLRTGS